MQNLIKTFAAFFFALVLFSCKKNISMISYQGGTPPVISANKATIPLAFATQNNEAITILWTNPAYKFSTGLNSQDVFYNLEIDTTGSNFTNPGRKILSVSKDLSKTFTQTELNGILFSEMKLVAGIPHNIEMRVTSSLSNNSVPLTSNVIKFTAVTPYVIPPKVAPPASGKLFITGSATPASWQCGCGEAELVSQKFTQVTPTFYVLPNIALVGGASYLLLPQYGSWSAKYGYNGSNNANNVNGDEFKDGGGDIKAPAASGNYKIEVDFQAGRFTVTKL